MNNSQEIKIGSILSYLSIAAKAAVGIFFTPLLTSFFGQSEYGLYSMVSSIITYVSVLDFGFSNAIIVFASKAIEKNDKKELEKLFGMFLCVYILIGILALIVSLILYFNFDTIFSASLSSDEITTGKLILIILSINVVLSFPLSVFSNIVTAYEKFIFSKTLNIIRILLQPAVMIPLLFFGYKSISYALVNLFVNILILGINAYYCFRHLKINLTFKNFEFRLLGDVVKYSVWIFIIVLFDQANWMLDKIILGAVCGTQDVAIYDIAMQFNSIYLFLSAAIANLLLPKISKMEENKSSDEDFSNLFIKVGRIQFIIMLLALSGFIIFGLEFINLLFGTSYTDSYYIAIILITPITITLIQNTGLNILQAKNKYYFRSIVAMFVMVINIVLSYILAHYFSGYGTAFGTALTIFIGDIICLNIYYWKKININIPQFWKEILRMLVPILILAIAGYFINSMIPHNPILLFIKMIVYTILYSVVVYSFVANKYEINLLYKPLSKFSKKLLYTVTKKSNL